MRKLMPAMTAIVAIAMLTASYAAFAEDSIEVRKERRKKAINAEIERAEKECPKADSRLA